MNVLLNELAFQKVLLNSIDDTVQNREAAEEEVRAEIRTLEKQIRDLKRGSTTASNSQPSGSALLMVTRLVVQKEGRKAAVCLCRCNQRTCVDWSKVKVLE